MKLMHVTTVDLSLRVLLAYQLRRFAEEGFEVVGVSAPGPYVAGLQADGIRHVAVPELTRSWSPAADARALGRLVRVFRRERPQIVHTHNPKSGVLGRVAARLAGVPVVVNTVHGLYANPALPPVRRRVIAAAEWAAARFSDVELFQSTEDYRTAIRTRMVRGSRAMVLGNGVDLRRFHPDAVGAERVRELRASWGAGPGDVVAGTVGRLVREKGLPEFFEAARRCPGVRFVAVGPAEPGKADALTVADLEAARAAGVLIHGDERDMPAVYAAMDLFVLASHREGMPRSAIEASAMGRAVVATDIRGSREVVEEGISGVLVPVGDVDALAKAVSDLASDPVRREKMGAAGRKRAAAEFDEERVVERTLAVYRRLLARRGLA
jgi:glycosyltransferase involved in cell wall biosynthesis